MRILLMLFIVSGLLFVPPVFADKGKPAKEQTQKHQMKTKSKVADADRMDLKTKEKNKPEKPEKPKDLETADEQPKGLEKQREKKAAQEQKELGKGSEQGQQSRENRRKWWKFWGDEQSSPPAPGY